VRFYTLYQRCSGPGIWNCWNWIAVMFELRCSELRLFCSESGGKPLGRCPEAGLLSASILTSAGTRCYTIRCIPRE
jgi:hypothetical protein